MKEWNWKRLISAQDRINLAWLNINNELQKRKSQENFILDQVAVKRDYDNRKVRHPTLPENITYEEYKNWAHGNGVINFNGRYMNRLEYGIEEACSKQPSTNDHFESFLTEEQKIIEDPLLHLDYLKRGDLYPFLYSSISYPVFKAWKQDLFQANVGEKSMTYSEFIKSHSSFEFGKKMHDSILGVDKPKEFTPLQKFWNKLKTFKI